MNIPDNKSTIKLGCKSNGLEIDSGGFAEVSINPIRENIEPKKIRTNIGDSSIIPKERLFGNAIVSTLF